MATANPILFDYKLNTSEKNVAHVDHRVEVALRLDNGGEVSAVH